MQKELNAAQHQASALEAKLHQQVDASQVTGAAAATELASTQDKLQQTQSQVAPAPFCSWFAICCIAPSC